MKNNFDLRKFLIENKLTSNSRLFESQEISKIHPILESIFDKVAGMVKGKSDKENATIDALKKFGIQIGKPFYTFRYLAGASKEDKALQFFPTLSPEQKEKVNVPIPNGFDGPIVKDGLVKITFQSLEEDEDGILKLTTVAGDYNFKTGKFMDDDGPESHPVESPDEIEKELGGLDDDDKLYTNGIKVVPYNGSLWQKFVDSKQN